MGARLVRVLAPWLLAASLLHCSGTDGGTGGSPTGASSSGTSASGTQTTSVTGATSGSGAGGSSADGGTTTGPSATGTGGASSATTGAGGASGGSTGPGTGGAGTTGAGTGGTGPSDAGVDPSAITASAIGANATIGLEWPRVSGATAYRIYWSNTAGVTPQSGQRIEVPAAGPTYVHRGLTNGMDYYYVVTAVTGAGEGPPSAQTTAKPAGEWALEQLGSGDFDDIATGNRVPRIPIAKRVHVLLLAEGYLASELPIFHDHAKHNVATPTNDVDRWLKEIFELEPYSKFQEGFVVWYLPRASTTHTEGGMSAFGAETSSAAGPLWTALDDQGPDAFLYPPVAASRNFLASFLLFDPARMRAGVSGFTSTCTSPANRALSMRCAFGIGHAHEFTHAFSNVWDEYIDNGNSSRGTSETANVVATNKCPDLPWKHLLEGAGINTTPQLVGAFGRPMQGYHSEFRCHMNGTHDNGEAFCGAGTGQTLTLRPSRFCNFCRELIAFHLLYRTEVLAPPAERDAFQPWKAMYRDAFFKRFGFTVPTPVPQTVMCGSEPAKPVWEACVP